MDKEEFHDLFLKSVGDLESRLEQSIKYTIKQEIE